jgi:hypothetical protein
MINFKKILRKDESILVSAEISKTFYNPLLKLYALGALLLLIGYEYEIGVIGAVLIIRTLYVHTQEIKEKRSYHAVLTQERLIILKGHAVREIIPIELSEIRTIYIKPITERFKRFLDVGTLEVLTTSGGRYVVRNVKEPYLYHRAIIGDVVSATHYSNKMKCNLKVK